MILIVIPGSGRCVLWILKARTDGLPIVGDLNLDNGTEKQPEASESESAVCIGSTIENVSNGIANGVWNKKDVNWNCQWLCVKPNH